MVCFREVTAYSLLLVFFLNCIFWILHGYKDAWGAFISGLVLSELFHDVISKRKSIKVHVAASKLQRSLRTVSKIGYDVLVGRCGIWSVLYWIDPPERFPIYIMSLLLVRKLLKLLSKQERYMSVTPIRIVLAVILIPLIALMIIAPRITKELLLLGKHLKDFIKSQNIPWKRMLEEKLKEYIQQGKAVELTMEGMSEMIIPNTIKAYPSSGIMSAVKSLKDDFQSIANMISNNQDLQKNCIKCASMLIKWLQKYMQTLSRFFVFLSTLFTFLNFRSSMLSYLEMTLKPIDKFSMVVKNIRKNIRAIVYGGLIKFAVNFMLLFLLGSILRVPFYASLAFLSSCLCLVSQPLYHIALLLLAIYSSRSTSPVICILAGRAFWKFKRRIRHWAHEKEYRFPLTHVILGYFKFGLAGIFLWPISMSLLYEVFTLLFLQNQ